MKKSNENITFSSERCEYQIQYEQPICIKQRYEFPGGHRDDGEDILTTAKRELKRNYMKKLVQLITQ